MTKLRNLFELPKTIGEKEYSEIITQGDAQIIRIISNGQTTPVDQWYDQETDEWVVLLEGEAHLLFEGQEVIAMHKGDYLLIKAHEKHRVVYTSTQPPCVWLAIHSNISLKT
jgi:cupin 2 domain-containing protein